jgi:hypothetical protein
MMKVLMLQLLLQSSRAPLSISMTKQSKWLLQIIVVLVVASELDLPWSEDPSEEEL